MATLYCEDRCPECGAFPALDGSVRVEVTEDGVEAIVEETFCMECGWEADSQ